MWTKVFPKYLMGRIPEETSYHRLPLDCENKHYEAVLRYDCGVFFVFSCKTKKLRIKTKVHFKWPTVSARTNKKISSEIQLLGKLNGRWELLNKVTHKGWPEPDKCVVTEYDLFNLDYEEFQVCLPAQGRIDEYLWIETDEIPVFKTLDLTAVFLGSSVSQDNNDMTQSNICCYIYRTLGINTATVGISTYHSFHCPELLAKLKTLNPKTKLIVMDLYHATPEQLIAFKKQFTTNTYYLIINSICRQDVIQLLNKFKWLDSIHIDGNGRFDEVHLNAYGTTVYVNELIRKGIL